MKIELINTVADDIFYKKIVQQEKQDFLEIVKKLQVTQKKKYSVYAIAAKIACGENVSSEELKYIKENAPVLFEEAKREYREKVEKNTVKEEKQTKPVNQLVNNSQDISEKLTKNDSDLVEGTENNSVSVILNKIITG